MAKGMRNLTSDTAGGLTYDQAGFDLAFKDHTDISGNDHKIFHAKDGAAFDNNVYYNVPTNKIAHWIGIHNCGTSIVETCSVQAKSISGDDLSKNGTYSASISASYVEIMPGDVVYGKFTEVAMLKTSGSQYVDILRLIRGV